MELRDGPRHPSMILDGNYPSLTSGPGLSVVNLDRGGRVLGSNVGRSARRPPGLSNRLHGLRGVDSVYLWNFCRSKRTILSKFAHR